MTAMTLEDYKLVYWPGIPGRGEFIRVVLEQSDTHYSDSVGIQSVLAQLHAKNLGDAHNPPPFAPPILIHGDLTISQTPNILLYLGPRLALAGPTPDSVYRVHALALTALDGFCNEVHDCHHPISTSIYYQDQRSESLRRSQSYVNDRLPKFLAYFEKVLRGPAAGKRTPWLHADQLTYADLVLFQGLHGTEHQFPRAVAEARASGKYDRVFALHDAVVALPRIAAYLKSDRRQPYGEGVYRYYKELDVVAPEEDK